MAEYIEREAVIEVLRKSHSYHAETSRDFSLLCRDIRLVKEQPAADVEEVVRCEECRHYGEGHCLRSLGGGSYVPFPMDSDDFCSYGERREDND